MIEFSNPFRNAKVISEDTDTKVYLDSVGAERGSKDFIMSNSAIGAFAGCPSRWLEGYRSESTDSTDWGDLIDTKILQPEKFDRLFAVKPATYPDKTGEPKKWNGNATYCKEWAAEHKDFVTVSNDDDLESNKAVRRLMRDEAINEFIACSRRQVMVIGEYHDRDTNLVIPVKALLDLVPSKEHPKFGRSLADLKTARSAAPRAWRKQVYNFGYHRQASWHWDLYVAATKEDRVDFRHIISENVAPYEPGRRTLSLEFVNLGRQSNIAALQLYCRCLASGKWPTYDDVPNNTDGFPLCEPEPYMTGAIPDEEPDPELVDRPTFKSETPS